MSMHLMHGEWCEAVHGTRALVAAPAADVLTLTEVKDHLRVDFADDDDVIQAIMDAVIGTIDPASGGWLGRALRPQTWEFRLVGFPSRGIELPYPPLISVASIIYVDANGVDQTLAPVTGYRILGLGTKAKQVVAPLYNARWPNARIDQESVRIRYTSGYPAADPNADPAVVETLPPAIKAWLKLVIGALYANRESVVTDTRVAVDELPPSVMQMISTYRVYG